MNNKFFLSIFSSVILTVLIGNLIKSNFNERLYYTLSYEHIGRSMNINYLLLGEQVTKRSESEFPKFISKLSRDLLGFNDNNPCTLVRENDVNPNIIVKYEDLYLEISMFAYSEDLLKNCEKHIDKKIKEYEKIIGEVIKANSMRYLFYKDIEFETEKIENILKKIIKNELNKIGTEENIASSKDREDNLRYINSILQIIEKIKSQESYSKVNPNVDMNFVTKLQTKMSVRETNMYLLYFCLFIIIQTIFLVIFFNKEILNDRNKKKIKKIFSM